MYPEKAVEMWIGYKLVSYQGYVNQSKAFFFLGCVSLASLCGLYKVVNL